MTNPKKIVNKILGDKYSKNKIPVWIDINQFTTNVDSDGIPEDGLYTIHPELGRVYGKSKAEIRAKIIMAGGK